MNCKYTSKNISDYLLNKMNEEQETDFQWHLSQCPQCQKAIQQRRNLANDFEEKQAKHISLSPLWYTLSIAAVLTMIGYVVLVPKEASSPILMHQQEQFVPSETLCADTVKCDSAQLAPSSISGKE